MPFHYILANLMAQNERALGVLFLDDSGETVDLVCSNVSPEEMRILGAYLKIYLRDLEGLLSGARLGQPQLLHIEKPRMHIHALPLPEGYYLALVQRPPVLVAPARLSLLQAGDLLRQEIFGGT